MSANLTQLPTIPSVASGDFLYIVASSNQLTEYKALISQLTGGLPAASISISAGASSAPLGSVVFSNSNGVSFGLSGSTITASYTQSTVSTANPVFSAGTSSASLSEVIFSNSNGISFGLSNNTITASYTVPATAAVAFSAGTSSATLTEVVFSNSNGVTFGLSNSVITASYSQSTLSTNDPVYSAGTSSGSLSELVFSNSNGISFGLSGSTLTASYTVPSTFSQSTQPAVNALGVSNVGNTSGNTGTSSGITFVIAGTNNLTVSQSTTPGGPNTIWISGPTAGTAAEVAIADSVATITNGTVVFSNSNNVTFGLTGSTMTASASFSQTVQTQDRFDLTLSGNTSGTLALVSSGTLTLAGGNNITLSQVGNAITISGANAGTAAQLAIADSAATISSGTVVFSNSNNVSFGLTGSTMTASASFNQTVQTQNLIDVTLSGNTSGTLALISSGTMTLAGGNNVTLSQVGNAVTISAANQTVQTQGRFDLTLSGNTSGTLALVSSGTLTLAGGNNITLSQVGNAVTISGAATAAQFAIADSANTVSSGTVIFSNSNNVSFGLNGSTMTASASFNQTNQTVGDYALGNTTLTTSTTWDARSLSYAGAGIVTVGFSSDSGLIISATTSQSVQTQSRFNLTLSGNTSGTLALVSSGTLTLAGGNNVTLSQVGNAVTISAANQTVQTQNLIDVTLSGNTSGTLALISSGTLTLAGGNNITLSQNGNAVTISAANGTQSNQTVGEYMLGNTTLTTSSTWDARSLSFAGAGIITIGQSSDSGLIISATQSVQTQSRFNLTLSGNTSGTLALVSSGTLTLAGGNNITLSQVGNAVTISAFTQTVQTQNCVDVTLAGNTTGTLTIVSSGTLTLAGGNNITLSQNGNAVTISAGNNAQSNQTVGEYMLGNTTLTTSTTWDARSLSFAGAGIITVGVSSNSGLIISAVQSTQPAVNALGVSNTGNTAGNTGTSSGITFVVAGTNNITISQSTSAGGPNTIWVSGPNTAGGGGVTASYWANLTYPWINSTGNINNNVNSTQFVFPFFLPYAISASFLRFWIAPNFASATAGSKNSATATGTASQGNTIFAVIYSQGVGASSLSLQNVASGSAPMAVAITMSLTQSTRFSQSVNFTWGQSGTTTSSQLTTAQSSNTFTASIAAFSNFASTGAGNQAVPIDLQFATSLAAGNYWCAVVNSSAVSAAGGAISIGAGVGFSPAGSYGCEGVNNTYLPGVLGIGGSAQSSSINWWFGHGVFTTNAINTTASIPMTAISASANNSSPIPKMEFCRFN